MSQEAQRISKEEVRVKITAVALKCERKMGGNVNTQGVSSGQGGDNMVVSPANDVWFGGKKTGGLSWRWQS